MTDKGDDDFRAVPSGRAARMGQFGGLAAGVVGNMIGEGAKRFARGERPKARDLLLTPGNAKRVADRLSHLRGAAMKMGQMISMDAGDILPAELSAILARLREQATRMPPTQLNEVLKREWGENWRQRFKRFEPTPVAAASIGQVHRAEMPDGRKIAVKVQYPGVAGSIDSDVDNVAGLLKLSGALPKSIDLAPLLAEAKIQLQQEADYVREGAHLAAYKERLAGDERYIVPGLVEELTTPQVLAMDWIDGVPVEKLMDEPQEQRDRVTSELIELVLRELFEFGVMQTDPNFANYRYQPDTGRLVLLDFGATRDIPPAIADDYAIILRALWSGNVDEVRDAALAAGYINVAAVERHRERIDRMICVILGQLASPGDFDFGDRAFVGELRAQGMAIAEDREAWH
ncbi:MAG: AarF/ABC1/UbiB kinase family protein, partial [Sphingomonadaceae bacterium]